MVQTQTGYTPYPWTSYTCTRPDPTRETLTHTRPDPRVRVYPRVRLDPQTPISNLAIWSRRVFHSRVSVAPCESPMEEAHEHATIIIVIIITIIIITNIIIVGVVNNESVNQSIKFLWRQNY